MGTKNLVLLYGELPIFALNMSIHFCKSLAGMASGFTQSGCKETVQAADKDTGKDIGKDKGSSKLNWNKSYHKVDKGRWTRKAQRGKGKRKQTG